MQKILIVGGGLAGSCLAFHLGERGCDVTLIDSGVNVSSRVAAGMINPLVFRRMTKSWRVDEFIPYAIDFYRELEELMYKPFFHEVTIRRFFSSEQERNFWLDRQSKNAYQDYMNIVNDEDESIEPYANQYGSGRVKNSFYLNTNAFLDGFKAFKLIDFREESLNYADLDVNAASYKGEVFDEIIFCEGYQAKNNPWFGYLPINTTKGETITIKTEGLSREESFNRKCFTLHLGEGIFRVGATYDWHTANIELTTAARDLLLDNLRYLTDKTVEVVDQNAGIRPTTLDRRPFMGRHKDFPKISIFNGLGTKGYMMAPLLAKEMCDYLLDGKALNSECILDRVK